MLNHISLKTSIIEISPDWFYNIIKIVNEEGETEKIEDFLYRHFSRDEDYEHYDSTGIYKRMIITISQAEDDEEFANA